MRHLTAWWQGEARDAETGYSHLWHAGCCIVFLIAYEIRGVGTDDRPPAPITAPDDEWIDWAIGSDAACGCGGPEPELFACTAVGTGALVADGPVPMTVWNGPQGRPA